MCVHACMYIRVGMYAHVCIHACMCVRVCNCMWVCVCVCVHARGVCAHTYVCMLCMHVCLHLFKQKYSLEIMIHDSKKSRKELYNNTLHNLSITNAFGTKYFWPPLAVIISFRG